MPSFLRIVNQLSVAYAEGDLDLVKELCWADEGVVFDDDSCMPCGGHFGFDRLYSEFVVSTDLTCAESDLTFEGLARFGITKFYDFEQDVMCVAGFSRLPSCVSVIQGKPPKDTAQDAPSAENTAPAQLDPHGKPLKISTFGGNKRSVPRRRGPLSSSHPKVIAKKIKRRQIR